MCGRECVRALVRVRVCVCACVSATVSAGNPAYAPDAKVRPPFIFVLTNNASPQWHSARCRRQSLCRNQVISRVQLLPHRASSGEDGDMPACGEHEDDPGGCGPLCKTCNHQIELHEYHKSTHVHLVSFWSNCEAARSTNRPVTRSSQSNLHLKLAVRLAMPPGS